MLTHYVISYYKGLNICPDFVFLLYEMPFISYITGVKKSGQTLFISVNPARRLSGEFTPPCIVKVK